MNANINKTSINRTVCTNQHILDVGKITPTGVHSGYENNSRKY
jgi:hypothetical protein